MVLDDKKQIQKNQIKISWEYAKQQNDIHCRLYLQLFVVYLTIGVTLGIAIIVEELDPILFIVSGIFILFAFYYIIRLRTLPDELKESWQYIIYELEKLK